MRDGRPMRFSQDEADTVARTVWAEARGEPWLGQVAVAWVIRNRASCPGWWGTDLISVCRAPAQFSCWHDEQLERLTQAGFHERSFRIAYAATIVALEGIMQDPTHGATHYYSPKGMKPPGSVPKWVSGMDATVTIGNHEFFRERDR
jgi:N-acetylmuramoyl-L-alanine amidase